MELEAYRQKHDMTYQQLADLFGRDVAHVWRWCRGYQVPRADSVLQIKTLTNGAVTPRDFGEKK